MTPRADTTTGPVDVDDTAEPVAEPQQSSQQQEPSRTRTRTWLIVAVVVGFLIQAGWRIYLSRNLITPAAHADEDGYLLAARALAGGPGGSTTENGAFRRMGYPMLIAPVYWFVKDAFQVYRGVLLLNALLNALVFPLAFVFARRVLDLPRRTAYAAAFVAALLPAVVFYSEFAMTDAVLAPIALGWLVLLHRWLVATTVRGKLIGALGSGAVAGFFYVVHVRGTMVVLAHVLLLGALFLLRSKAAANITWRLAAGSLVAAGVVTQLDRVLKLAVGDAITSIGNSPKSQTIGAVTTLHGFIRMTGGASGQLWYLCVATFGIGAVAVVASALPLLNVQQRWRDLREELNLDVLGARRIVITAVLATTLLIALGSSAALPPGDARINYYAYPRYIHLLFPVWLLIGLYVLRVAKSARQILLLTGLAAGMTVVTAGVVKLRVGGKWGAFLAFDGPETSFLGWRWTSSGSTKPTGVAVAGFARIVGAVLFRRRLGLAVTIAGLGVVQLVMMPVIVQNVTVPMENMQYLSTTPKLVEEGYLKPGDVVAYARRQEGYYYQYNVAREVNWTALLLFDQTKEPVPAEAGFVIAPWHPTNKKLSHWDGTQYGFSEVVADKDHHWALWKRI